MLAVTRYVWAVYRIRHRSGQLPLGNTLGSQLTVPVSSDYEGFKRCGLKPYSDDSELAVGIQSRALEAFVVARNGTTSQTT